MSSFINDCARALTNLLIVYFIFSLTRKGTTMLESMWSSMSSSMQLAQECLEKNGSEDNETEMQSQSSMEGLEKFAQTIDNS